MPRLESRMVYGSYPEIVTSPGHEAERVKILAGSYLFRVSTSTAPVMDP